MEERALKAFCWNIHVDMEDAGRSDTLPHGDYLTPKRHYFCVLLAMGAVFGWSCKDVVDQGVYSIEI
jgi:hypothetical protein